MDDESLVRRSVHILLQGAGYLVDVAKNGAEALAMFEPGKFDMIFIDYLMPEMKGDKLAAAIKERSPQQPIVMLTAFIEKFQSSDSPPGGVDSFIGKPFELETLRAAIDRYAPA
ncbi:MAG TPA: response regulator [Verrucomicrobiae bacterium]|nr:response regulator [Verrucomicrobiae bacterium]